MMTWTQAMILGIVEGVTEFLPISSTGHLILVSRLMNIATSDFLTSFEIAIQLGAILAVVLLYGKSVLLDKDIVKRVLAAFVPTAILGFIFYKVIKNFLLTNEYVVVAALLAGGVILIVFELFHGEKPSALHEIKSMSYPKAALLGVFQSFAMVPGVSRSAATIIGGLCLGLSRKAVVEFSFLLAVPTMAAATGLDLIKNAGVFSVDQISLLAAGFLISLATALISIKFLLYFIQRHNFMVFGFYRIGLALAFLWWMR